MTNLSCPHCRSSNIQLASADRPQVVIDVLPPIHYTWYECRDCQNSFTVKSDDYSPVISINLPDLSRGIHNIEDIELLFLHLERLNPEFEDVIMTITRGARYGVYRAEITFYPPGKSGIGSHTYQSDITKMMHVKGVQTPIDSTKTPYLRNMIDAVNNCIQQIRDEFPQNE